MSNFPRILLDYIRQNLALYILLSLFLIAGIILGSIAVNMVSDGQLNNVLSFINGFLSNVNNISFDSSTVFYLSLSNNLKTALALILLGVTVVGAPLIFAIILFRGFALGFTVGFFIGELGIKGVIFSLLSILPQNLIIVPAMLSIGVAGIAFSATVFKNRGKLYPGDYTQIISSYLVFNVFFCIVLVMSSLIEGYISPVFIKFLSSYM